MVKHFFLFQLVMSLICFHSWLVAVLNLASPLVLGWVKGTSAALLVGRSTACLPLSSFFGAQSFILYQSKHFKATK